MDKTITYLNIIAESLKKKKENLVYMYKLTLEQEKLLQEKEFNLEQFNFILNEKDKKIKELNELDEGFEMAYANISTVIKNNKENYETQIKEVQGLIREITDIGVSIEGKELFNKALLEKYLLTEKEKIKKVKVNSKTTANYYMHMANQPQNGESYFVDKKN